MAEQTHVAFLRAVNVGGRTARKEQLVAAALAAGATEASTFIASGNLLFSPGDLQGSTTNVEATLEDALAIELGFSTEVFVRSLAELERLGTGNPFDGAVDLDSGTYSVGFLRGPLPPDVTEAFLALATETDHLAVAEREVHWHTVGKMTESPLFTRPTLEKVLGVPVTKRNIRTVRRLVVKLTG